MASLREVKNRINSVKSTRKITSAMRMVSSAKLNKLEQVITNMLPYQLKMEEIVGKILGRTSSIESPFTVERKVNRIAIVALSSNNSLCGGFNNTIIRSTLDCIQDNIELGKENILIYPIGRKIEEALKKRGFKPEGSYQSLVDKPNYSEAKPLAQELMQKYIKGEVDKVIFIYFNFKSIGTQVLKNEIYLPLNLDEYRKESDDVNNMNYDYIVEPSERELITRLIPQVLGQKFYTTIVDSMASGEAARSLAMQTATDNADDLIQDLTKQYNKTRQQAITNELLDIVGGSMQ